MKTAWNIADHEEIIEAAVDRCATMWSFYSEDDPYVIAKPLDGGASGKPGVSRFGFAVVALVSFVVYTAQSN